MSVIIILRQDDQWISVNLFEDTNETHTDLSTGRWSVRASSQHPSGGPAAENDLSPVNPQYYVWLFSGASLVLADNLSTSAAGGANPSQFDSNVWLMDVWRKSTENYVPTLGATVGRGRFWRGRLFRPGSITWGRQPRQSGSRDPGLNRSPPTFG